MAPEKYLDQYPPESIELMPTAVDGRKIEDNTVSRDLLCLEPTVSGYDEEDRFKRECVEGQDLSSYVLGDESAVPDSDIAGHCAHLVSLA